MPGDIFTLYLDAIERAHRLGNDTEHTHRPALKTLLEAMAHGVTATNEPKRVSVGAPDYVITRPASHGHVTLGYVEAKDIGMRLEDIERDSNRAQPNTREGHQLRRYRAALPNLLFTDYLAFRWYVNGECRQTATLATMSGGSLAREKDGGEAAIRLLRNFLDHKAEPIAKAQELALRMARLTHIIRDIIVEAFEQGQASSLLKGWRKAFADVLITDLDQPQIEKTAEFADMFAQTLAYGLFSARIMDTTPEAFSRQEAQYLIPKTNPFLRRFFYEISGPDLEDEPYAGFVNDLAALLQDTDMEAVLADFGKRTRQQDPVVHFYETFLAAYDPRLRESRGVYYTPEPVVSYIVRSVDYLLKARFGCPDGLADSQKVRVANTDPALRVRGKDELRKTMESHRVLILDPACGTGTFAYAIVDLIREQFKKRNDAGMWSDYVRDHLLPRLFGFELLMAPYAVAHFKLGLQLAGRDLPPEERAQWAYDFAADERLRVYLTNTLEGPHEYTSLPLFTQFLANETAAANSIKRDLPIMVVIGNPPYSGHSANKGQWINDLLRGKDIETGSATGNYFEVDGQPLGEKNPKWLNDDYVKFIRFAQWRIERTGAGILAFISNNGYIDNPTFRGMRQALMQTSNDIYILNLHGNSKKGERSPDGSPDENVFDIQQGVCIGLFVKEAGKTGPATVNYADLWGVRESKDGSGGKYPWLLEHSVADTSWADLSPQFPSYLFVPQNVDRRGEYEEGWKLTEAMPVNVLGFQSHRDHFAVDISPEELRRRIGEMLDEDISDLEYAKKYNLTDNRDWQLAKARKLIKSHAEWENHLITCLYRPFDQRACFFSEIAMDYPRRELLTHVGSRNNLCLNVVRQTKMATWQHALVSDSPAPAVVVEVKDGSSMFPLYLYPDTSRKTLFDTEEPSVAPGGRRPNLSPAFIADMEQRLGMAFVPDGKGDLQTTFGPEDVFNYMYAVFHSPTYRARYAEFLKIDFPRVPLTSDPDLFRSLCNLGGQLVGLHLMEITGPTIASYPVRGDNRVEGVRYTPPVGEFKGRVYINKAQYFEGVTPEVWEFHIGGYQVAEKWLKDRKGRQLSYDDLGHYSRVVAALAETMRLMGEVDSRIPGFPIK